MTVHSWSIDTNVGAITFEISDAAITESREVGTADGVIDLDATGAVVVIEVLTPRGAHLVFQQLETLLPDDIQSKAIIQSVLINYGSIRSFAAGPTAVADTAPAALQFVPSAA